MTMCQNDTIQTLKNTNKKRSFSPSNSLTHLIDNSNNDNEKEEKNESQGFSPFVTFCFTINYMVGTGFLTIPWAFTQGGLALSAVVLILVGMLSDGAKGLVLETMARAEVMLNSCLQFHSNTQQEQENEDYTKLLSHDYDCEKQQQNDGVENQVIKKVTNGGGYQSITTSDTEPKKSISKHEQHINTVSRSLQSEYTVGGRKFEITQLTDIFIGSWGTNTYTAFLFFYNYCLLWAYTSVFCSALSSATGGSYVQYALFFAAFVLPMSCMDLSDQVVVQVLLAIFKFIMIGLMLGTCQLCARDTTAAMMAVLPEHDGVTMSTIPIIESTVPLMNVRGLSKLLPIICYGVMFHQSIPGLSHPVTQKKHLSGIFRAAIVSSSLIYGLAGIVLAYVFGRDIQESVNLNWNYFHAGTGSVEILQDNTIQIVGAAWWAKAISVFVVCFPAVNVLSGFPLNAITLGDNLLGSYFGKQAHEAQNNRWIVSTFRLIASVPPIILAIFVRQLGTITDYAGTTGFMLAFTFPAFLYWKSREKARELGFSVKTRYSFFGSSVIFSMFMLVFGIGMFLFTFLDLLF